MIKNIHKLYFIRMRKNVRNENLSQTLEIMSYKGLYEELPFTCNINNQSLFNAYKGGSI